MNAITWIILSAIVLDLILNLSADALNLQQVRSDVPDIAPFAIDVVEDGRGVGGQQTLVVGAQ